MSQISHGMNVAEVRQMGVRLQSHHAESIRALTRQIDGMVESTTATWIGPDAERFRGWWPEKRSALGAIAEDLRGFGQAAINNANEQEIISGR